MAVDSRIRDIVIQFREINIIFRDLEPSALFPSKCLLNDTFQPSAIALNLALPTAAGATRGIQAISTRTHPHHELPQVLEPLTLSYLLLHPSFNRVVLCLPQQRYANMADSRLRDISGYLILLIAITTLGSLQFGFHLVRYHDHQRQDLELTNRCRPNSTLLKMSLRAARNRFPPSIRSRE